MNPNRSPDLPTAAPGELRLTSRDQRRHGRLVTREAICALGRVMDISASGLRVRRSGQVPVDIGEHLKLEIQIAERTALLPVQVVRLQKAGFFATDIGLEFRALDDAERLALTEIARMVMSESRYRGRRG